MKKIYLFAFALLFFLPRLWAQEDKFIGTWHMIGLKYEKADTSKTQTEKQLVKADSVWIMTFEKNGVFRQQSNMNSEKRMDKMEGKWKIESSDRITVILPYQGQMRPIHFFFTFMDNGLLRLERYDQLRTVGMYVTMKKDS